MTAPRRVAITGVGVVSPYGRSFTTLMDHLQRGISGVKPMPAWQEAGLATAVAAYVEEPVGVGLPRQQKRTMSRVAQLAVMAASEAIACAGLSEGQVQAARTGLSFASTMGGTSALESYFRAVSETNQYVGGLSSTTFPQIMSHTCAANVALAFGIRGRSIASCTACAASTQSLGFAYETIRYGLADTMIAGGAEELHASVAAVFDTMRATSTGFNTTPTQTPRPFAVDRDGIVVGEGAGALVLEEWEQARQRGASIWGEIIGFETTTDSSHMTTPSAEGMEDVMRGALAKAGLQPEDVDYVNAHGTATLVGDRAETQAIARVFGTRTPVSSLKGHFGHLMGAAGVVETAACLGMMTQNMMIPTLNLGDIDPECAPLHYLRGQATTASAGVVVKNSFAFGGVNATLILRRPEHDAR